MPQITSDWKKKKGFTVSYSPSLNNLVIIIKTMYGSGTDNGNTVYLNENCNSDFSDIRFTYNNEILPYYREQFVEDDYAIFFVKLSGVNVSTAELRVCYNNPNASYDGNPSQVFENWQSSSTQVSNLTSWTTGIITSYTTLHSQSIYPTYEEIITRTWGNDDTFDITTLTNTMGFLGFNINVVESNIATGYYVSLYDSLGNFYELEFTTCAYYQGEIFYWKKNGETLLSDYELDCGDKTFTIKYSGFSDPWSEQYTFNTDGMITKITFYPTGGDNGNSTFTIYYVGGFRNYVSSEIIPYDWREDVDYINKNLTFKQHICKSGFRKQIILSSTTQIDNYQVKFNLYYSSGTDSGYNIYLNGKCNLDFSDVWFLSEDTLDPLPHWFESITNGSNAAIWVKIPKLKSSTIIYIYYGGFNFGINDGNLVFEFFDDFSQPTLDTTKWNKDSAKPGFWWTSIKLPSISQSNGILLCGEFYNNQEGGIYSKSSLPISTNFIVESRIRSFEGTDHAGRVWVYQDQNNAIGLLASHYVMKWNALSVNGGSKSETSLTTLEGYVWYKVRLVVTSTSRSCVVFDDSWTQLGSFTFSLISLSSPKICIDNGAASGVNGNNFCQVDWIYVRKHISEEPSTSYGLEEFGILPIHKLFNVVSKLFVQLGYKFRKLHKILPATNAGTGYQIRFKVFYGAGVDSGENVYLDSNCNSDFSDVKFYAANGRTILTYWIEEKIDGSYAIFWVKVLDDLSVNPAFVWIYYGKENDVHNPNGANTFLLFDDFTSYQANTPINGQGGWVTRKIGGSGEATVKFYNGKNHLYIRSTSGNTHISKQIGYSTNAKAVRSRIINDDWNESYSTAFTDGTTSGDYFLNGYDHPTWGWSGTSTRIRRFVNGNATDLVSISDSGANNIYYRIEFCWYQSSLRGFRNDVSMISTTNSTHSSLDHIAFLNWSGSSRYIDWVFVRKYVEPEPQHAEWYEAEQTPALLTLLYHALSSIYATLKNASKSLGITSRLRTITFIPTTISHNIRNKISSFVIPIYEISSKFVSKTIKIVSQRIKVNLSKTRTIVSRLKNKRSTTLSINYGFRKRDLSIWKYKSPIIVNSGAEEYNLPLKFVLLYGNGTNSNNTIYMNGNCHSTFKDIRFKSQSNELLPYFIESFISSSIATVWVNTKYLKPDSNTFYIYYGNDSAHNLASGIGVFYAFDDFDDNSINVLKWTIAPSTNGTIREWNGTITLASNSGASYYLRNETTIPVKSGIAVETLYQRINTTQNWLVVGLVGSELSGSSIGFGGFNTGIRNGYTGTIYYSQKILDGAVSTLQTFSRTSPATIKTMQILTPNSILYYENNSLISANSIDIFTENSFAKISHQCANNGQSGLSYMFVRKLPSSSISISYLPFEIAENEFTEVNMMKIHMYNDNEANHLAKFVLLSNSSMFNNERNIQHNVVYIPDTVDFTKFKVLDNSFSAIPQESYIDNSLGICEIYWQATLNPINESTYYEQYYIYYDEFEIITTPDVKLSEMSLDSIPNKVGCWNPEYFFRNSSGVKIPDLTRLSNDAIFPFATIGFSIEGTGISVGYNGSSTYGTIPWIYDFTNNTLTVVSVDGWLRWLGSGGTIKQFYECITTEYAGSPLYDYEMRVEGSFPLFEFFITNTDKVNYSIFGTLVTNLTLNKMVCMYSLGTQYLYHHGLSYSLDWSGSILPITGMLLGRDYEGLIQYLDGNIGAFRIYRTLIQQPILDYLKDMVTYDPIGSTLTYIAPQRTRSQYLWEKTTFEPKTIIEIFDRLEKAPIGIIPKPITLQKTYLNFY